MSWYRSGTCRYLASMQTRWAVYPRAEDILSSSTLYRSAGSSKPRMVYSRSFSWYLIG